MKLKLSTIILFFVSLMLASCGAPSRSDTAAAVPVSGTIGGGSNVPTTISLSTDKSSVKSDNSDKATLTATVYDANNAPVEGVSVTFSSTGGSIATTSVTTDATGTAITYFSSGTIDKSNKTVTITAAVFGVTPIALPIQITGSTVALSATTTSITSDGVQKATLTATVKDAANANVFNAPVTFTVSGTGGATVTPATGNTNTAGQLSVIVAGTVAGDVTVTATSLGATADQVFTVTAPGSAFAITAPAKDPASLNTSVALPVTVSAPAATTSVTFATSLGTWENGLSTITKSVVSGSATATLTSLLTGVANVMAYDSVTPKTSDSITVVISAPSTDADTVSLQSDIYVLPPSTQAVKYNATLTATVETATHQAVGGAQVVFSIVNPTGGGETVSPVVAITDASGKATTTFTSGSKPSMNTGVQIRAAIIVDPADPTPPTISTDDVAIVIGGTVGSIVIGRSTTITDGGTYYSLPMSVLVSDSNGSPVSGANVSLSVWPAAYTTDGLLDGVIGTFPNEDRNQNLNIDAGEDLNGDLKLDPPSAAAGNLPGTVTTGANGVANFNLTYLKNSAIWITDKITAGTMVQGTETRSTLIFTLPYLDADLKYLPQSPYTAPLSFGVPNPIELTGAAGSTVSTALTPTFGTPPYTFSAIRGSISSGVYSVVAPSTPGVYTDFDTITIHDSSTPTASLTVKVNITVP